MKKISLIKSKRHVIYAKKSFVSIMMMKIIKTEKRLKITAIKDKFRGAAQSKCTLNYKIPKDIPIINHNASYDTHFIINQLAEKFTNLLVLEKIWKNISLFLYESRKNVVMVKKFQANWGLLIVLDLCQLYYQNLLIIPLEFLIS